MQRQTLVPIADLFDSVYTLSRTILSRRILSMKIFIPGCYTVCQNQSSRRGQLVHSKIVGTFLLVPLCKKRMGISWNLFFLISNNFPQRSSNSRRVVVALWVAAGLSNNVMRAACQIERKRILITFLLLAFSVKPPIKAGTRSLLCFWVRSASEIEKLVIMATMKSSTHFSYSSKGSSW